MHRFNTHTESRVMMAVSKIDELGFRYQGHLGAHLIVGGVDAKGPQCI